MESIFSVSFLIKTRGIVIRLLFKSVLFDSLGHLRTFCPVPSFSAHEDLFAFCLMTSKDGGSLLPLLLYILEWTKSDGFPLNKLLLIMIIMFFICRLA